MGYSSSGEHSGSDAAEGAVPTTTPASPSKCAVCTKRFFTSWRLYAFLALGLLGFLALYLNPSAADHYNNTDAVSYWWSWHVFIFCAFLTIVFAPAVTDPVSFYTGVAAAANDAGETKMTTEWVEVEEEWIEEQESSDESDKEKKNDSFNAEMSANEMEGGTTLISGKYREVGFFIVVPSVIMGFLGARNLQDAATAGYYYGIVGVMGYCGWYLAYLSCAVVVYRLRVYHGYRSLAEAINYAYGRWATLVFGILVAYRLHQIVWSNAVSVAGFMGAFGSTEWWIAVAATVSIPMFGSLIGGMRWSLINHVVYALICAGMIAGVGAISGKDEGKFPDLLQNGDWTIAGGIDIIILTGIQGLFSFPFFNATLTDRAFLSSPAKTLVAFFFGFILTCVMTIVFAFLGMSSRLTADAAGLPQPGALGAGFTTFASATEGTVVRTAEAFNPDNTGYIFIIVTAILTAAITIIDSAFVSFAKLVALDMGGIFNRGAPVIPQEATAGHMRAGRFAIVFLAVAAVVPLISGYFPDITSTTTYESVSISATVVIGLGPPLILLEFVKGCRPWAFHLPVWFGMLLGVAYKVDGELIYGQFVSTGDGPVTILLGVNFVGYVLCVFLFLVGCIWRWGSPCWSCGDKKVATTNVEFVSEEGNVLRDGDEAGSVKEGSVHEYSYSA